MKTLHADLGKERKKERDAQRKLMPVGSGTKITGDALTRKLNLTTRRRRTQYGIQQSPKSKRHLLRLSSASSWSIGARSTGCTTGTMTRGMSSAAGLEIVFRMLSSMTNRTRLTTTYNSTNECPTTQRALTDHNVMHKGQSPKNVGRAGPEWIVWLAREVSGLKPFFMCRR